VSCVYIVFRTTTYIFFILSPLPCLFLHQFPIHTSLVLTYLSNYPGIPTACLVPLSTFRGCKSSLVITACYLIISCYCITIIIHVALFNLSNTILNLLLYVQGFSLRLKVHINVVQDTHTLKVLGPQNIMQRLQLH
jgi:hypothetical protein